MSFPLDKRTWKTVSSIPVDELSDLHLNGEELSCVDLMLVAPDSTAVNEDVDGKRCSTCNLVFETLEEQRNHFKTDLHRFNLKRTGSGLEVLTQSEMDALAEDVGLWFIHRITFVFVDVRPNNRTWVPFRDLTQQAPLLGLEMKKMVVAQFLNFPMWCRFATRPTVFL